MLVFHWLGFLQIALLLLAGAALAITVLANWAARSVLARSLPSPATLPPPLSVLRPAKGLDEGFEDNLRMLLQQSHPRFEVLLGVAEAGDPAYAVGRRVAADFPAGRLRVFVCPPDGGLNPKVTILRRLAAHARHDLLLISDSNVRPPAGYLQAIIAEMADPHVGLVTNLVRGEGARAFAARTFAARCENLHLATFVVRGTAFAGVYLDKACVVGKSMLFRRSQLEKLGGWAPFADLLAEDYAIGNAFERAGFAVVVSPLPVVTFNQSWSTGRFFNRHLRWSQMRRRVAPWAYLFEPLGSPTPLFLGLACTAFGPGPLGPWALPLALAALGFRLAADRRLLSGLYGARVPWRAVLATWPKDFLIVALWAVGAFRRTVDWRGNVFLLGPGSRLSRPRASGGGQPVTGVSMKEAL